MRIAIDFNPYVDFNYPRGKRELLSGIFRD